jgi:hypothetical protein
VKIITIALLYQGIVIGGFTASPLFARNLPSNVSKPQDLRPKIRDSFAISGDAPLALSGASPFSKFLDPPLIVHVKDSPFDPSNRSMLIFTSDTTGD